jgi:hypothetical protein
VVGFCHSNTMGQLSFLTNICFQLIHIQLSK